MLRRFKPREGTDELRQEGYRAWINLALLLAGLFTILVARIVDEAVFLADEVRATI